MPIILSVDCGFLIKGTFRGATCNDNPGVNVPHVMLRTVCCSPASPVSDNIHIISLLAAGWMKTITRQEIHRRSPSPSISKAFPKASPCSWYVICHSGLFVPVTCGMRICIPEQVPICLVVMRAAPLSACTCISPGTKYGGEKMEREGGANTHGMGMDPIVSVLACH